MPPFRGVPPGTQLKNERRDSEMKRSMPASVSTVFITLVLLVTCAVATTSCAPATPPSTTSAPLPEFVIADFDNCTGTTRQRGQMGAAYDPSSGDRLVESYEQESGRGCRQTKPRRFLHRRHFTGLQGCRENRPGGNTDQNLLLVRQGGSTRY